MKMSSIFFTIAQFLCSFIILAIYINCSDALGINPVFLDVDEMNLVQYDVKIGDQPIVLNEKDPTPPKQVSTFDNSILSHV